MMHRASHQVNKYDTYDTWKMRWLRTVTARHPHETLTTSAQLRCVNCAEQRRDDVVIAGSQDFGGNLAGASHQGNSQLSKYHRGLLRVSIEHKGWSMIKKKPGRRVSHAWAREDLEVSGDEVTLVGREQQDEIRNDPALKLGIELVRQEQNNIHKLQNRAVIGLGLVLLEVAIIVMTAIIGVAEFQLETGFAEIILITTVPPSIGAWMFIVKRMFPTTEE
jgi:hypothetical protein